MVSKQVEIRLYFNRSNNAFYLQIGEHLIFVVPDKVVTRLSEKENLDITHGTDIKEIQKLANEKPEQG